MMFNIKCKIKEIEDEIIEGMTEETSIIKKIIAPIISTGWIILITIFPFWLLYKMFF